MLQTGERNEEKRHSDVTSRLGAASYGWIETQNNYCMEVFMKSFTHFRTLGGTPKKFHRRICGASSKTEGVVWGQTER